MEQALGDIAANRAGLASALAEGPPASLGLYYEDGDSDAFWNRAAEAPEFAGWIRDIREEGRRLQEEPIPQLTYSLFAIFAERGSRLEYERAYFERRRRLNTFALLTLLEPDEPAHRAALQDIIWLVCDEYTWCLPAHVSGSNADIRRTIDLFSAETGFTLTEISMLLGDRLPSLLRQRIADEVEIRLFAPYLSGEPYHWETARHNWAAVCAGSIGSAALLAVRDPQRLAEIAARTMGSMDRFLEGYGDDGACPEGLGYWNYGFGYYVYFADLLRKRTNGALDLMRGDKVRRIAQFQQKVYLGGDRVANFSDSVPRARVQMGLTHYLAGLYPEVDAPPLALQASYLDDHCSRWAPALRHFVWFDASRSSGEWRDGSFYLPDAQWLISRHRTAGGESLGFAAKAGHNAEPHNHNDIGQFILLAAGETFIADLGSGEYTQAYFGSGRYEYDCNGSQGHAVPIVDGSLQAAGLASQARVLEAVTGDGEDRFRFEMASAYRVPHLQSLVRGFVWRKRGHNLDGRLPCLELTDEFRFVKPPGSLIERFVTFVPPELAEDGVVLRGAGERALRIRYDAAQLDANVEARSYSDHFGRETPWYAVDFAVKDAGAGLVQRMTFTFEFN
ncbi:heparinase II/III family protein [Cohnella lubricantis]|uniref:Heparinase II/III family protein n=1 Tax=Cohnella lubricantis TaxID=2163172 RepID=A0A841TGJ4_9BACL|nr:heparinase II/III family protein [Cohnella lubricantis]MBB6679049.1 heparinase II/III family protein [Cohnella lubricantis]MBP2120254.1 hypothetical protein [Cohnella lubricantis]